MNFWKEHFDHFLLLGLGLASAGAAVWCDAHHMPDASKWLYGQATGFSGALMLRLNARNQGTPQGPESPKV